MVLEEDIPKATEILDALKEIRRKNFACPHCGSHNIEYVTSNRKAGNIISALLGWMFGNYAIGYIKYGIASIVMKSLKNLLS